MELEEKHRYLAELIKDQTNTVLHSEKYCKIAKDRLVNAQDEIVTADKDLSEARFHLSVLESALKIVEDELKASLCQRDL